VEKRAASKGEANGGTRKQEELVQTEEKKNVSWAKTWVKSRQKLNITNSTKGQAVRRRKKNKVPKETPSTAKKRREEKVQRKTPQKNTGSTRRKCRTTAPKPSNSPTRNV